LADQVVAAEGKYPYRQSFFRYFAVPRENRAEVLLVSGGIKNPNLSISEMTAPPRFVGFFSEGRGGRGAMEMTRQFLIEEATECIIWQLSRSEPALQCSGVARSCRPS
jgi:hypothetical protein